MLALLDPELTVSMPQQVTIQTGLDALVHAVETAVTRVRTPVSTLFSQAAFRSIVEGLPVVLGDPSDLEARAKMLLGAAWAGVAIEQSMLGAAHSLANPLTARFGVPHGTAVGRMLPAVVRFNASDPDASTGYSELAAAAGFDRCDAKGLADFLERQLDQLGSLGLQSLTEFGVDRAAIPQLGVEAAAQWTAQFNPRAVDAAAMQELYDEALGA